MIISLPTWLFSDAFNTIKKSLDSIAPWRLVGGVVRDILLDKVSFDIDIAIAEDPEKVFSQLRGDNIKVIPTGLQHGTVSVYAGSTRFEITSLRRDMACDGRHAQVSFTYDWQADASRRDFTINAMYLDMEGNLYDYFGGQQHLLEGKLVFVGTPIARVQEDYLRILRYWRFLSVFGLTYIDAASQQAAVGMCKGLDNISGERIKEEMFKLLASPFAFQVINLMIDKGVLTFIGLHLEGQLLKFTDQAILNLALLLLHRPGGVNKQAIEQLSKRWRLSNMENKKLYELCLPKISINWAAPMIEHKKYVYMLGWGKYMMRRLLAVAQQESDMKPLSEELRVSPMPVFPLRGDDIVKLGLQGRAIGLALQAAEAYWMQEGFGLQKEQLLLYIKRIYSI